MFKHRLNQLKNENVGMFDLASIGITLALAICIGYFGGKWIGGKLGNTAVGAYIGFGMGVAAGFMEMFRSVARWNRRLESIEKQRRGDSHQVQNTEKE
ncbi:MAG: AtpZ/AtpI family protein [Candidatus Poribacteria bacterium]|nr:AtpZ/AtpI family protein [Candidatus Poribacteria bacterium]MDD9975285.1 AtpZ/AtpI family protein [Candidatus Poribacteria bacterium]